MIRVRAVKASGLFDLSVAGHSQDDVCCAAGMIMQAAILGLRDLAKQYPKCIAFEAFQNDGWTDAVDSTDKRKKKA